MKGTQNGARGVGPAIDTQGFGEGERSVPKRARSSRFETKRATFFFCDQHAFTRVGVKKEGTEACELPTWALGMYCTSMYRARPFLGL